MNIRSQGDRNDFYVKRSGTGWGVYAFRSDTDDIEPVQVAYRLDQINAQRECDRLNGLPTVERDILHAHLPAC